MKRLLFVVLFLCVIPLFSSCSSQKEIKSITIGENTYYSVYLCSFDNADINYEYTPLYKTHIDHPTSSGYVFVKDRSIERADVWQQFYFNKDPNASSITSEDVKIHADIVDFVENYAIRLEKKRDTYVITYYTFSYSTDTDLQRLKKQSLEKHTIEVTQDDVIISYYN